MTNDQVPMTNAIRNPKSKIQNPWTGFALISTLLVAGCGPVVVAQHKPQQAERVAQAEGPLDVVMAAKPQRKTLTLVSSQPARVQAIEQTPIHSRLGAYVAEVSADYGDRVKRGQTLIALSVPEMEVEVLQKQALVDQAAAETKQAEASRRATEAAIETARAQVVQAETGILRTRADTDRSQSEYSRFESLAKEGAIDQRLVDEARQKLRSAEAAREEAEAGTAAAKAVMAQAQAEVEKAAADVVAAEARQRVAAANLKYAQTMLAYAEIKAPFDGVITARNVDPGHFVQPNGAASLPLVVVARTDVVRVFAAIPEIEVGYVDVGDEVTIEVQSLRGATYSGKVARTSFALDAASRSLETIVDVENTDGKLRPGMFATARLTLEVRENALVLPAAAIVRQNGKAHCYRLIDGKAVKAVVELGIRVGDDFEVASGLSDGDTVILNKAGSLQDGQPVSILKPASPDR
jgi:RND family efflux transporter MFP subunit